MLRTEFIRIDNVIVEKLGNSGFRAGPIKLFETQNKIKLDLKNVPYVASGSRIEDSLIIQRVLDGTQTYESLNIIYPDTAN